MFDIAIYLISFCTLFYLNFMQIKPIPFTLILAICGCAGPLTYQHPTKTTTDLLENKLTCNITANQWNVSEAAHIYCLESVYGWKVYDGDERALDKWFGMYPDFMKPYTTKPPMPTAEKYHIVR